MALACPSLRLPEGPACKAAMSGDAGGRIVYGLKQPATVSKAPPARRACPYLLAAGTILDAICPILSDREGDGDPRRALDDPDPARIADGEPPLLGLAARARRHFPSAADQPPQIARGAGDGRAPPRRRPAQPRIFPDRRLPSAAAGHRVAWRMGAVLGPAH